MAKVSTLIDPFTTFTTASGAWTGSYGTPTLTSGQIHLSCISGYEGLISAVTYDVSDSFFLGEFASIPTGGGNSRNTEMTVRIDASNWVSIGYVGTQMYCRQSVAGVVTDWETFAYNATNHRWWKVQHVTGTGFTFYTSPEGITWTQQGTAHTSSLTLTAMLVHIFCGYYGTETSPPDAVFDNFNVVNTGGPFAMQLNSVTQAGAGEVHDDATMALQLSSVTADFAGVASPPAGDIGMQLNSVTEAFAAVSDQAGPFALQLNSVTAAFVGATVSGDIGMQLNSVTAAFAGSVNPIGAFGLSLNSVTMQLGGETIPFAANVIHVEAEKRGLRVIQDDPGLVPIYLNQVTDA